VEYNNRNSWRNRIFEKSSPNPLPAIESKTWNAKALAGAVVCGRIARISGVGGGSEPEGQNKNAECR
jgi:hypothetical protein